tara:strand:- start:901 stop:1431 length:531 start_codon:yes stop_codon:yes gene_type:complete
MEEKKTLVERIKELVFTEDVVEQDFVDVKTSEGLVLRVDSIEEGAVVTVISEDGENVSGASDYVLEDGVTISVNEEGVITSVTPAEEEEAEVVEEDMSEESEVVTELTERELAVDAKLAEITEALEGIVSKFESVDKEVNKFAKAPADEEKEIGKTVIVKHSKQTALEALSSFRKK